MIYDTRMKDENLSPKLRCGPGCEANKHCQCCHKVGKKKELKKFTSRQLRRTVKKALKKIDPSHEA